MIILLHDSCNIFGFEVEAEWYEVKQLFISDVCGTVNISVCLIFCRDPLMNRLMKVSFLRFSFHDEKLLKSLMIQGTLVH